MGTSWQSTTDKPRLIIVCSPKIYLEIQKIVVRLHLDDVLVRSSQFVTEGEAIVIDHSRDTRDKLMGDE